MTRMIEALYDLARARQGGGIPIEARDVDLRAIAEKAVAELRATDPKRVVDLTIEGDLKGRWDSDRLEQLLSNLVGNAMRHSDPETSVRVSLDGREHWVSLDIHNGGVIDLALLPHLFEPFRRGQRSVEGLGLGLYIVQQIARAHGSSVTVHSQAPDGTTFSIRLPRVTNGGPVGPATRASSPT